MCKERCSSLLPLSSPYSNFSLQKAHIQPFNKENSIRNINKTKPKRKQTVADMSRIANN